MKREVPREGHPNWPEIVYDSPMPLRSTSLDKVTCQQCWQQIANMAARLGYRGY